MNRFLRISLVLFLAASLRAAEPVPFAVKCADPKAGDQDDCCIWVHPTDPARSTVIAADKAAGRIFVYDLAGKTLDSQPAKHPGNIDLRRGFSLGGKEVDVVAYNQRVGGKVVVLRVDPATRGLVRIDDGDIDSGENYGGALFRSPKSGKLYFVTTSYRGRCEQIELFDNGRGQVAGKRVRSWKIGLCEAALGDDATGRIYIGEESRGVWELGGEPDDPAPGRLAIQVGEHGLTGDVEGLAIYDQGDTKGLLIVSNQGRNDFKVYRREGEHAFVGTFAIRGATQTDGVEVTSTPLGPAFPGGLFACHAEGNPCPILLTPWAAIARAMPEPR